MVLKHLKLGQRSFRGHFSSFSPASCVLLDYKTIPLPLTSLLPSPSRNIRIWRQTFPSLLLLVARFIMGCHKSTGSHAWRLSWIEVISDLCHIFYGILSVSFSSFLFRLFSLLIFLAQSLSVLIIPQTTFHSSLILQNLSLFFFNKFFE